MLYLASTTYWISKNTVNLKSGSEVTQGHSKLVSFNSLLVVSYQHSIVTLFLKYTIFEIFTFKKYCGLKTRISSHSRSLVMTPFDRSQINPLSNVSGGRVKLPPGHVYAFHWAATWNIQKSSHDFW